MTDPMQEIRASFFVECEELLEALQDGLQTMSDGLGGQRNESTSSPPRAPIKGAPGGVRPPIIGPASRTIQRTLSTP